MFMFPFHSGYALYLLSIAAGCALYIWGLNTDKQGKGIATFFGMAILLLSIVGSLCNAYFGIKYWPEGHANTAMGMNCMMGDSTMPMKGMPKINDHADMVKK
jgi:hypothetical protein